MAVKIRELCEKSYKMCPSGVVNEGLGGISYKTLLIGVVNVELFEISYKLARQATKLR